MLKLIEKSSPGIQIGKKSMLESDCLHSSTHPTQLTFQEEIQIGEIVGYAHIQKRKKITMHLFCCVKSQVAKRTKSSENNSSQFALTSNQKMI
jgi:hypothetical protein